MIYTNDFKGKRELVKALADIYRSVDSFQISDIELKKYVKGDRFEEFILLTWDNGAYSTANNNINSLSATAENVARMLDGGVYENIDFYKEIMRSPDWEEL